MKQSPIIIIMTVVLLLVGCTKPETILITSTTTPTLTPVPTPMPECHKAGTLVTDEVLFADIGANHSIMVYLPPCYAEHLNAVYPVLYWANGNFWWQQLYDTTNRLASQGDVPAFITVLVQIDPNKGFGADAQIVKYVVPYIDSHYRTQPDRLHRSITGFSNGAAIAIRAAFQAPDIFNRVAVLSGGIANGEQEKFTNWISAMPPDQRPEVMIDVGDQDVIVFLTHYLTETLDTLNYPYTFVHGPGDHSSEYTDDHLENILTWLMAEHQEANK
jgi:enterochelin esterase-like enzyme